MGNGWVLRDSSKKGLMTSMPNNMSLMCWTLKADWARPADPKDYISLVILYLDRLWQQA